MTCRFLNIYIKKQHTEISLKYDLTLVNLTRGGGIMKLVLLGMDRRKSYERNKKI